MSWLRKFVSRTKEKIVMNILTRIIDAFKAKNPKVFAYAQGALLTVQALLVTAISLSTNLVELPELVNAFPWIENIPTAVSGVLSGVTYLIQLLIGSSTPGSAIPIKMNNSNEVTFVKKEVAEKLIVENKATKIPISK